MVQGFFFPGHGYAETPKPYRLLVGLDLRVFACSPNPRYHLFSSQEELERALRELSAHCRASDFEELEAGFSSGLAGTGIQWQKESLVVVGDWYGTGMAKAHLEFSMAQEGILDASIVWEVPPPPVTPDTAVFRGAFIVDKSSVAKVRIRGREQNVTEMSVTP